MAQSNVNDEQLMAGLLQVFIDLQTKQAGQLLFH
jgi:hypothetical protein